MKIIPYITFLVFILVGCSASGPVYQEQSLINDRALVYIYRPSNAVNCCVAPTVYINGSKKDKLKNGGYLSYELEPGENEIIVGDSSYGFELQTIKQSFEKNAVYYFLWLIGDIKQYDVLGNYAPRDYYFIPRKKEDALGEISNLKLSR